MEDLNKHLIFANSVHLLIRGAMEMNGGLKLDDLLKDLESIIDDYKNKDKKYAKN